MIISTLKTCKHRIFLLSKRVNEKKKERKERKIIKDNKKQAFNYNPDEFINDVLGIVKVPNSSTFVVNHLAHSQAWEDPAKNIQCPHRIFMVWAGDNEIPPGRRKSIEIAQENNTNFDFALITPNNLKDWEVPEDKIPAAFHCLSYNHQSDFLRAYLLHHHGGVYMDIKNVPQSWQLTVDRLNNSPDILASGVREISVFHCNPALGPLGTAQQNNFSRLISVGAVACKPGTIFTFEWLSEVKRRLKYFEDILLENPAEQPWGSNPNYPVPWTTLGGSVFSPLCLKYSNSILAGDDPELTRAFINAVYEGKHRI